jgi:hypothetical protein
MFIKVRESTTRVTIAELFPSAAQIEITSERKKK